MVLLDHRVNEQISTRRLRIAKYRGSLHGTNEYPFIIDHKGFNIVPITSAKLDYTVPRTWQSTGIPGLDSMLNGKGVFEGSTIMISGSPGTGKTSISVAFANSFCQKDKRCIFFALEESPDQLIRNMQSIGLDIEPFIEKGLLQIHSSRPSMYGLETHLSTMVTFIEEFKPDLVIIDPITNLISVGIEGDVKALLTRMIDYLKTDQITTIFTALLKGECHLESTTQISSWIDAWILLEEKKTEDEVKTWIRIVKSRGMTHSKKIREFQLTQEGIRVV